MNSQINLNRPLIESPRPGSCRQSDHESGWRRQFACPTGRVGRLVGHLMAFKNAGINNFAVETLDVKPEGQILEIGFGHGRTIQQIAGRAPLGFVAGIDISEVMVRQATKRNRDLIKTGRVDISRASVSNIPYEYARFDSVLAVNNFQFWPNSELNLDEIRRVLREDGRLVLCLRLRRPGSSFQFAPGFTQGEVSEIAGLVRWVGFKDVKAVNCKNGVNACCVVARR